MEEIVFESESPSFISGWFIDKSICDGLINFYNEDNYFPVQHGSSGFGYDKNVKDSYDKCISPNTQDPRILVYLQSLSKVIKLYTQKYKFCDNTKCTWKISDTINIQMYPPNGGYKIYHSERDGNINVIKRFLTFMTYLNDVTDCGETEFYYQKLKVQPKKGLTLIWPVDWTHTHRGIPSPSQEKIIITGWYNFT